MKGRVVSNIWLYITCVVGQCFIWVYGFEGNMGLAKRTLLEKPVDECFAKPFNFLSWYNVRGYFVYQQCLLTPQRGTEMPSNWTKMTHDYERVRLSPDARGMITMEYEEVAEKFKKTMKQATILQIERVQNEYFWNTYQL